MNSREIAAHVKQDAHVDPWAVDKLAKAAEAVAAARDLYFAMELETVLLAPGQDVEDELGL
jgi:hypothetical protein